jgi:uncharacterized protein YkwD
MHGEDPWAHTAPVYDGPPPYSEPEYPEPEYGAPYDAPPGYGRPPTYPGHPGPPIYPGPPGYDEIVGEPPNRRMSPLAIAGMIAAILISLGLVFVLLSPTLSGKRTSGAGPNLPGVLNDPTGTPAPQLPAPEVQVPSEPPTPSASAVPSPSATGALVGDAAAENAVVALVNADRKKAKCDPVNVDDGLRNAARQHSADMATRRFLNHRGSDGSSPDDRMRAAGYGDPQSENLARGFTSAKDVMRAWEHSRNDRRNILDCDAKAIGVGVAVSADGTPFWTQDFGA